MGGKDSIVVDADADLDAAVEGVAVSAFGFQGQKCSACSRAIVDERIYDEFVEKLAARVAKIARRRPGRSEELHGPGRQREGAEDDLGVHREGQGRRRGSSPAASGRASEGYFIEPTVIADVAPDATIAQEEIFGPVLAVIQGEGLRRRARHREQHRVRSHRCGLSPTTRTRSSEARDEFFVGNLYLNRKCTGRLVGVHPFGGFNMSGTDSQGRRPRLSAALHAGQVHVAPARLSIGRETAWGPAGSPGSQQASGRREIPRADGTIERPPALCR